MTFNPNEARNSRGEWTSGSQSPDAAKQQAEHVADGHQPLAGLPHEPIQLGTQFYVPGPVGRLHDAAEAYMKSEGLSYNPPQTYAKLDKNRAVQIAAAFDRMKNEPDDPVVKASYEALARETIAQWRSLKDTGLKVDWIKPGQADPYADSPRRAAMDVSLNNHWWGLPSSMGFGTDESVKKDNIGLRHTGEIIDGKDTTVTELFRVVHDMYGHFKEGNGFRAEGEENAWRSHAAMFSPEARPAMTALTRGQNSWVNYGPYGEHNRTASAADTHFAPEKIGLLPRWVQDQGRLDHTDEIGKDFQPTSPKAFIVARDRSARPGFLTPLSEKDLADHLLLMNKEGTVGISLNTKTGDLGNLFNNGGPKGAAAEAFAKGIISGGRTGDAYDGFLPDYYHQFGFEETSRQKFNPEFAHDWNIEKQGTPDVVFLSWKGVPPGGFRAAIERASTRTGMLPRTHTTKYGNDWDAQKAESAAVAKKELD